MRRLLGVLGAALISSTVHAAVLVPVELSIAEPGVLQFASGTPYPPTVPGLVLDWSISPENGSGSGHFEISVGNGHLEMSHSGTAASLPRSPDRSSASVDAYVRSVVPLRVELTVPDFGESMTTIAFVKKRLGDSPSGVPVYRWNHNLYIKGHLSSSLLGSDLPFGGVRVESSTEVAATYFVFSSIFEGGGLLSLPSGDRVILDVEVNSLLLCIAPMESGVNSCSVNGSEVVGFDVFAISPEAQNSPAAQCTDGLDNDGDGAIDLADVDCANPDDTSELQEFNTAGWGCGLGPELALLLPVLYAAKRARRRQRGWAGHA